eukprot:1199876-Pyramimonas_sp.AAC.1
MAPTETTWDGSVKARTDLVRKRSCAVEVAVTPAHEQSDCHVLDRFKLRQAFPPQEGKTLLHLQWPSEFRLSLQGMDG